jgi:zinc and cadmium transporter
MKVFLLVGVVVLGGLLSAVTSKYPKIFKYILAFSGAYLLSMSITVLLPEVFTTLGESAGIWILVGFVFQILLEMLTSGMEHGHVHKTSSNQLFFVCLGLAIHAIFEGMPISSHHHHHHHHMSDDQLLYGILVHKLPIAMVFMGFLTQFKIKTVFMWLFLLVFALLTPLGMLISQWGTFTELQEGIINSILIGLVLHVSTTIIFEAADGHKFKFWKMLAILIGGILAIMM